MKKINNKIKNSFGRKVFVVFNGILLFCICLVFIVPLWNVLITSVAKDQDVLGNVYLIVPKSFSLKQYSRILQSGYFKSFVRSIIIATIGTMFSMTITLPAGYTLAQKNLVGRNLFMNLIIITMIFDVGLVPFYVVVRMYGLINTYFALVIPVGLSTFNLILIKNFISSIPDSLIESARIDGANELIILIKIIIPVSIPIIAAITLFYFIQYWNRYIEVVMFIHDNTKTTLQVLLRTLMFESESATTGAESVYDNFKMAIMVMGMLPVLVLYPFIQRYFISGIMLGSIKG
ncbi:MAG: carbohydrate ABC transporter permease [Spirochaetes bacterium]|nr:carbohydrate ABC transporter permease [Spirochaetota bacterium]